MRINRSKVVRKCLKFFRLVYNIADPYDVVLDSNFIIACQEFKIDIRDRLLKLLQCTQIRIYILQSALNLLKSKEALAFATSQCTVLEDDHLSGDSPAWKLVSFQRKIHEEYINNASTKHKMKRYLIATQDGNVRTELRTIPGVPVLYANKVTLILEAVSEASKSFNTKVILVMCNNI